MLSTWAHKDTTWTTVDISTAFLTVKMPAEQLVLLKPPAVLIKLGLLKETDIWIATRAVYGLRSAPRLWEESRDDILRTCDFVMENTGRCYSLCKSSLSPSIWYILPCALKDQKTTDKKIKNDQRSDQQ
eukprot:1058447-Amphidinium_carterae.1